MDALVEQIRINCTKGTQNARSSGDQTSGKASLTPYGYKGSPGHQSILDSHANSGINALIYIGVVLLLYIIFMAFIVMRYVLMKSHFKGQNQPTPYYFGGTGHIRNRGGTTTTGTTTFGGVSVSGYAGNGPISVFNGDDEETPPEIRFIETEL